MLYAGYLFCLCAVLWFCFIDYKGVIADKLLCLFMFPLMAFVTENVDRPAYVMMYNYIDSPSKISFTDPGFGLLMYIGRCMGLDYNGFMVMFAIIALVFVIITFRKLSDCMSVVLAFYYALVFPTFTVQIRSIIAEALLYILIVRMINQPVFELKGFILLLALAVLFHATSLFFALLLLDVYIKKRKWLMVIVAVAMMAVPMTAAILKFIPIPMIQQKIQIYLYEERARLSIGAIVLVMGFIALTGYVYFTMRRTTDIDWQTTLDRLLRVNLIGLIACVMVLVFSSNFYRMVRVILIVDIIILSNRYFRQRRLSLQQRAIIGFLLVSLFLARELATSELYNLAKNNSLLSSLMELY